MNTVISKTSIHFTSSAKGIKRTCSSGRSAFTHQNSPNANLLKENGITKFELRNFDEGYWDIDQIPLLIELLTEIETRAKGLK